MILEENPLLSIIVPVYNCGAYLEDLFDQFRTQDMSRVELVFVDDGSKDDSYEKLLAWKYAVNYSVSVFHQHNQGVSAARNKGMELATGTYLTFLDADDAVSPDYLETLIRCADKEPDVVVFTSRRVGGDFKRVVDENRKEAVLTGNEMLFRFWNDPTCYGVMNVFVRRGYLEEHRIFFAEGYKYYEDYDFLIQTFAQTDRIRCLDKVLYYYVMREGSAMGSFNADRINCLRLMKHRERWLWEVSGTFAPVFQRWGTSRLYWSVLWQAALAFPRCSEFIEFARITHAKNYLVKLNGYPDKLLQLSTKVFLACKPAYFVAVRLVGRKKSKVQPVDFQELQQKLMQDIAFY